MGSERISSNTGFYDRVVVTSISPDYYAANDPGDVYTIQGIRLDLIPDNAVGVLAGNNSRPEQFRYTEENYQKFVVESRSEGQITFKQQTSFAHSTDTYLGAIYSEDRSTRYWVNTRQPLP